jgi:hypothetical protein
MQQMISGEKVHQAMYDLLVHIQAHQVALTEFIIHDYCARTGKDVDEVINFFQGMVGESHKRISDDMFADYGTLDMGAISGEEGEKGAGGSKG